MPNFDGLRHLTPANLTHLSLGATKKKRVSLAILQPFTSLERLWACARLRRARRSEKARSNTSPNFRRFASAQLRVVHLDQTRALVDFGPIADAPGLREFSAIDMRGLSPSAFAPYVRHPQLEAVYAGLHAAQANDAVRAMFPHLYWGVRTKHPMLNW